ncbi:heat-inducible transcriptional repressor HrcA [Canibacter zhoujuaniae]|uniref:heat-inducible transcriptional repressor HrcA n=1 Tax=Canibacter zhoujuaniae TaxID=2708343 RepID=UPI00142117EF|nr:heat-inducible transcriptional repressor HrcA [Canibacter zhoujuaniae]
MVSERGLKILHAIVTDYVAAGEPVGSKTLATRYSFGVSAATIRNDMVALEEAELIAAPYTSSGRVPTDKGFRLYVDTLSKLQPLGGARRAAIERFLGEAQDLDEVLGRTVRLLAQLTKQVALVQYPSEQNVFVHHLDLVALTDNKVLCVVITGSGAVEQQLLVLPHAVSEEFVAGVKGRIAAAVVGKDTDTALLAVQKLRAELEKQSSLKEWESLAPLLDGAAQQMRQNRSAKLAIAGTANLSRQQLPGENAAAVLDALEEQVVLLQLFNELAAEQGTVRASIGSENEPYGLAGTAIVATKFGVGENADSRLGVLGPVNMDYAGNMVAVRAVARYLSKILGT